MCKKNNIRFKEDDNMILPYAVGSLPYDVTKLNVYKRPNTVIFQRRNTEIPKQYKISQNWTMIIVTRRFHHKQIFWMEYGASKILSKTKVDVIHKNNKSPLRTPERPTALFYTPKHFLTPIYC